MSFIYIASPYSDPNATVRHQRYLAVSYYVTALFIQKRFPYSPITANHHLALEFDLPSDANSWMAYNFAMLSSASELHVLKLSGWEKSVGVLAEINFWRAARQDLPIHYIDLDWGAKRSRKQITGTGTGGKVECLPASAAVGRVSKGG